jgi:hypothetical protein
VSHHFDSAADRVDGRINACDLYAFPAAPGSTALIVTVNPDAGRSSPTTFRPDALHEFVVANNGGTSEDIAFSVSFTEPDETGQQQVQVRRASGPAASRGTAGTLLGEGRTGTVFSLDLDGDGLAWAGLAADPFNGDGIALGEFLQALSQGRYTPEVFTVPSNTFAGRDVTAIALQLPDAVLGGLRVALWGRISLTGHTPKRQVNRIGQAMLRPLFFNPPATEAELDALNAEAPATDRDTHGERVRRLAATVARLAGLPDPDVHAEWVAAAFRSFGLGDGDGTVQLHDRRGGQAGELAVQGGDLRPVARRLGVLGSVRAERSSGRRAGRRRDQPARLATIPQPALGSSLLSAARPRPGPASTHGGWSTACTAACATAHPLRGIDCLAASTAAA